MLRSSVLVLALTLTALVGGAAEAAPVLERVVVVMRHGVRPPTSANSGLRQWSDKDWPAWIVQPGDLTPHGAQTVGLTGRTLRAAYRRLLPAQGCPGPDEVSVWSDGADERTQMTGVVLGASLEGGCRVPVAWAKLGPKERDQIFSAATGESCKVAPPQDWPSPLLTPEDARRLQAATDKLQQILAPMPPGACDPPLPKGSKCITAETPTASLAEDLLLEYAEHMDMSDVGWGRASEADIAQVMTIHEVMFARLRDNQYAASRRGAAMTRVIEAALQGVPIGGGPVTGPNLKLLGLAGHDTNLVLMASTFGLEWTLPGQPDSTAPSTALAFELWRDGERRFVRPVVYYQTLDQLRDLTPALGKPWPLQFKECASGPMQSCPLKEVLQRVDALIPPDCGWQAPHDATAARKP
jgi:4-phytase/acid phosphatase